MNETINKSTFKKVLIWIYVLLKQEIFKCFHYLHLFYLEDNNQINIKNFIGGIDNTTKI